MPQSQPLRIGILVDSEQVATWQYQLLERLISSRSAEVVLTVVRQNHQTPDSESNRGHFGYRLLLQYLRWDHRRFRGKGDPFALRELRDLQASFDTIFVQPQTSQWIDTFSDHDVEEIKNHNLDIIIRLGFRILHGDILNAARYGVWSYHHGDNSINRGGPPGFWEVYENQNCIGLTLQLLNEELDDGLVLAKSILATDKFSVNRTKESVYWRSTDVLPRKIRELHLLGADAFFEKIESENAYIDFYDRPLLTLKNLSIRESLGFIATNFLQYLRHAVFLRRYEEKWVLYFHLAEELSTSAWQFRRLESPNDRYWADPHVVAKDDYFYIFVEEFIYKTDKGRIAVLTLDKTGQLLDTKTVLELPYHLSYPSMFQYQDQWYMIPETCENRTIELYRCADFPHVWEPAGVLMDNVDAVDTSLYFHGGKWWMFTTMCDNDGENRFDELFIFSSDSPLSNRWEPHPMNPVVSDVRSGRPGGALFEHDGALYRPAQDCSKDYGYAMSVQRVVELTDSTYKEYTTTKLLPDWSKGLYGTHTLAYTPGITVIDARTHLKRRSVSK
ncbi:MAG: hypothetical protein KTR35_05805 [Gammaproteobacteria bacterium]|nr:hypothetical protein [Gammaproteobacteria bacterium]